MIRSILAAAVLGLGLLGSLPAPAAEPSKAAVLKTYADIAQAIYDDSLTTARNLQKAVNALIAKPSDATMKAAREAWIAARAGQLGSARGRQSGC